MKRQHLYRYLTRRKAEAGVLQGHDFDSSAVADLAFLLLIFFIVTSSFILRQGLFFSLPSESAGAVRIEKELMIDIYPLEKNFLVDGGELTRNELGDRLRIMAAGNSGTTGVVHMKPGIRYERLVDSLSLMKENGVKSVSLKTYE